MSPTTVLQSWKQIAAYVGRTERTIQRWEQEFGFPIHRPAGKSRSAVMALAQEIQEWTREKPSLVEIRTTARLSRSSLTTTSHAHGSASNCSDELVRQAVLGASTAKCLQHRIRWERKRHRILVRKQTQLREEGLDLWTEHQSLVLMLKSKFSNTRNSEPLNALRRIA
jgi:hypothetical protein